MNPVVQHPSVVIAVEDVRKAMAKVTAAGGQLLGEPMDIPGVGAYVSLRTIAGWSSGRDLGR